MFRLSRYYSIASLIGTSVVLVALSFFLKHLALQTLTDHQTRANVDITKSFANSTWHKFAGFVELSYSLPVDELRVRPEIKELHAASLKQMKDTNVVKIKVYNLDGMTVFSTAAKQIGTDKSKNKGFLQAMSGNVASEITFRNEFYAFEQVIVDRNLIATYIPIREHENAPVQAVFEVYSDVTPLVENMQITQNKIIASIFSALAILYVFLFFIVRRADNILIRQEQERKENEEKIRHQAYHDSLTGLQNRDSFIERFEEALGRAKRHNKNGALLYLDLDRFKLINDSLGHGAGDQLLRITTARIQKCLREIDLAFRLSGDEFIIILEDMDKLENATLCARKILETMLTPMTLNGHEVIANISIGITTFPKQDVDIDGLVKEADAAMHRAKEAGHNRYEFFSQEMNTVAFNRLSLETDLQRALQNNEFLLYYQAKVDFRSREHVGVEALLRWQHPDRGIVPPYSFISVLEDMGLINTVGEWVLNTACQQAQTWIEAGLQPLLMSVNISAKQFCNQNFVDNVRRTLEESGLDAKYLELELTESMFISNTEHSIEIMHKLKKLGIALSIDDFGTGYSSLNYLKQFPVDYLKIDRSFVKDMLENDKDAAIVSAISNLGQNLNLGVVVEGVENEQQFEILKAIGCNIAQGFLFSHPLPADEFEKTILRGHVNVALRG